MNGDPALGDYIPSAGADSSKLAGMGGVYNTVNLHLYHYAGNNPLRYTDPTGAFDWDTNTIQAGDTLSQIANDCNTRYGTNYSADDLKDLNSDTISDKDKIYAGNYLNLGEAEGVQKRAADYASRSTAQYSNEQDTLSPLVNSNLGSKGYSRGANIAIGLSEILLGIGFYVGSTITAVGIDVTTEGAGSYYAGMAILEGYATGSLLFAYGITRLAGSNNQKFKDDIVGTFVLPEVDVANSMNDYSKRRNK